MLSSMTLLFYYLAPLQNDAVVTSRCIQFNLGDKIVVVKHMERYKLV